VIAMHVRVDQETDGLSTMKTPSAPVSTPMVPPAPSSV
jgi:hypothetical protein